MGYSVFEHATLNAIAPSFLFNLDGVLKGYPGIAYPSTWQQGTGLYSYEPRYDVSQTNPGKNQLCANYYGFVRPSQVSGNGKQANCKTNITGIKVILKSKKGKAELALEDHQPFVCYFKGNSEVDSDSYHFHSAWTAELLRP